MDVQPPSGFPVGERRKTLGTGGHTRGIWGTHPLPSPIVSTTLSRKVVLVACAASAGVHGGLVPSHLVENLWARHRVRRKRRAVQVAGLIAALHL